MMDCERFIYGSTAKFKLSILNPGHNTEICLATGAFCTSPLESVYAESGKPALSLYRNLLYCNAVKPSTQSYNPSCSAVFHPSHHSRYELNIIAS
jgi:hypothetical protein